MNILKDMQLHSYIAVLHCPKVFLKLDAKNYIKCGTFANMAKLI